jgi:hypothetical protein
VRRLITIATAAAALVLLVLSAWHNVRHSRAMLTAQRTQFGALTSDERARYFGATLPLAMDIFDFYRRNLRPGDRYWMQVPDDAFSAFADKRTAVTNVAHTYLLPAIEVERRRDANVILSWDSDPSTLGLRYSSQLRAGEQLIYVSRVDRGS